MSSYNWTILFLQAKLRLGAGWASRRLGVRRKVRRKFSDSPSAKTRGLPERPRMQASYFQRPAGVFNHLRTSSSAGWPGAASAEPQLMSSPTASSAACTDASASPKSAASTAGVVLSPVRHCLSQQNHTRLCRAGGMDLRRVPCHGVTCGGLRAARMGSNATHITPSKGECHWEEGAAAWLTRDFRGADASLSATDSEPRDCPGPYRSPAQQ